MKQSAQSSFSQQNQDAIIVPKKQQQQFKALFLKNLRLQSKQIGTNVCQILTPIICILFTFLMKTITESSMSASKYELLGYPFKFDNYTYFDLVNPELRNPLQWAIYDCVQDCNSSYLGINNGGNRSGLLGNVYQNYQDIVPFKPDPINNQSLVLDMFVPFYLSSNNSDIDTQIFKRLKELGQADFDKIIKKGNGTNYVPDGAFKFTKTTNQSLKFDLKVNDARDLDLHPSNGISVLTYLLYDIDKKKYIGKKQFSSPTGSLALFDTISSSYLNYLTGKTLQSGYYYMPQDDDGVGFADTIISFVAQLVFPIALSLLFPVFLYTVVLEKQQKLIQMMKMNGMKISSYWAVFFCFNLMLAIVTNFIFVLFGYLLTGMRFFTETDPLLILFTLLGWSLAQIGLATFFQTFLSKSRSANIIGYLVSIWLSMISSSLSLAAYQFPKQCPLWMRLFAPTGFNRLFYMMLSSCSQGRCYGNIQNIPTQMQQQISFLYINFVFFFLLGAYLFQIIPQQFGVTRSPFFPITSIVKKIRKCTNNQQANQDSIEEDPYIRDYIKKGQEDKYSKKQRSDILAEPKITQKYPLVINNIRKLYKKQGRIDLYPAVRSFNLKVAQKQTFGLLGPNGAGKSTLISILTGMFEPNYGNAWIGGYDIKSDIQNAQLQMGVCPQFDLLWPQLTVQEHLYFYARLKGIPSKIMKQKIEDAIKQVKLTKFRNFASSSLSGGMKRRLSVAISLVGDPKIVFLDEPSTGLDPDNRRQLWEVLAKCQKKRSILITTHMMEEADTLCNRIGIITTGVLRTVGPQTSLKKQYGGGYRVTVSTIKQQRKLVDRNSLSLLQKQNKLQDYDDNYDQMNDQQLRKSIDSFVELQQREKQHKIDQSVSALNKFMQSHFKNSYLMKLFNGCVMYRVPLTYKVSQIFEVMQKIQKQLNVMDVAVTNSSLQDVFMNVASKYELQSEYEQSQRNSLRAQQKQDQFQSFPSETPPGLLKKQDNNQESFYSKNRESVMSSDPSPVKPNVKKDDGYSSDD